MAKAPTRVENAPMLADPLFTALEDALECPQVAHLPRGDRLALALWWLIESVADEFQMPPGQAADEVAMLCGLATEMNQSDNNGHRAESGPDRFKALN